MKSYQVVGIGNAIVDVFSAADDSFLELMGIEKGIMQLVEKERGELLYSAMHERVQAPGGSVANTLAGLGSLGLTPALSGGCMTMRLAGSMPAPWPKTALISSILRCRAAIFRPRVR